MSIIDKLHYRLCYMVAYSSKLKNKIKNFPDNPGVYWFSKNRKKIYIGRAASLKKRILNYFRSQIDPRIAEMVGEATGISFKKTGNLLEAVILETNLIKRYLPKYNIKEKDNRSFLHLVIPKEIFPRPFIARAREVEKFASNRGNAIFGPFQSYKILATVLSLIRKVFPFSACLSNQRKPCFDYQIGLCPGICVGAVSRKDYMKNINDIKLFFKGEHKRLFKKLKRENPRALFALKHINDVALISGSKIISLRKTPREGKNFAQQRIEGYDISHFAGANPVGAMVVFINGAASKADYRLFKIRNTKNSFDDLSMIKEILNRRFNHEEWPKPDIVLVDGGKNQVAATANILAAKNIFVPIVGIAKTGGRAAGAASKDRLFFKNTNPKIKKIIISSKILFQQVRNEAHRFAISFQKKKRSVK